MHSMSVVVLASGSDCWQAAKILVCESISSAGCRQPLFVIALSVLVQYEVYFSTSGCPCLWNVPSAGLQAHHSEKPKEVNTGWCLIGWGQRLCQKTQKRTDLICLMYRFLWRRRTRSNDFQICWKGTFPREQRNGPRNRTLPSLFLNVGHSYCFSCGYASCR